jgi:hypothetical protein
MRSGDDPEEAITDIPCEVVYTNRKGKRAHMASIDRPVDVWIDDMPHHIVMA